MEQHISCRARALRLRYGISLAELAGACGVSTQLISKIELEWERQTPAHELMLRNAFIAITSACKDRKARSGGRSWKRQRDDAVICA